MRSLTVNLILFWLAMLGLCAAQEAAALGTALDETAEGDETEADGDQYDANYERPESRCRRDPTWQSVDYEECQELLAWYPYETWWKTDTRRNAELLGDKQGLLKECLNKAFQDAKETYEWAGCDEDNKTEVCAVEPLAVIGHYVREDQGHIMTLANVLSEQEAFGLQALSSCILELLPNESPFFEEREFGDDEKEATYGMYNVQGGNFCTFMNGLLQLYLPGVAASIYSAIQMAYEDAKWADLNLPSPDELGIRTAEFLSYRKAGKLGAHTDSGSIYSISVALANVDDYLGGYFHLETDDALFKVPRRSAIVFFSETDHSITEIVGGERKVFVTELWDNEDVPVGISRPTSEEFDEYKEFRQEFLPDDGDEEGDEDGETTNDGGDEL